MLRSNERYTSKICPTKQITCRDELLEGSQKPAIKGSQGTKINKKWNSSSAKMLSYEPFRVKGPYLQANSHFANWDRI